MNIKYKCNNCGARIEAGGSSGATIINVKTVGTSGGHNCPDGKVGTFCEDIKTIDTIQKILDRFDEKFYSIDGDAKKFIKQEITKALEEQKKEALELFKTLRDEAIIAKEPVFLHEMENQLNFLNK